jgi:hypothetical protein
MERRRALVSVPAAAYAAVFVAAKGASVAAGSDVDGKVLFWNDDPAFNRVVDRLRQTPPETRVYSSCGATSTRAPIGCLPDESTSTRGSTGSSASTTRAKRSRRRPRLPAP